MTEIYKAGEHVKIVDTDTIYSSTLGDQTGLVGTISRVNRDGHMYITFPHTGDDEYFYLKREVERAGAPLPEPFKPKFPVGSWAKLVGPGYGSSYQGRVFEVTTADTEDTKQVHLNLTAENQTDWIGHFPTAVIEPAEKPVPEPKFKVGDWVQLKGYGSTWDGVKGEVTTTAYWNDRHNYVVATSGGKPYKSGGFEEKYLVAATEPKPEPKFKEGDWVKVVGRNDMYDGTVGTITEKSYSVFWAVTGVDGERYQFAEDKLELTEEPWAPKLKVGDWVEIFNCCNSEDCNGVKAQVKRVPEDKYSLYYELERTDGSVYTEYHESKLKATTKPEEPHWTEAKPVGTATRIGTRTIVKVEEDKWLLVYDTDTNRASVSSRNNQEAKNLFQYETVGKFTTVS